MSFLMPTPPPIVIPESPKVEIPDPVATPLAPRTASQTAALQRARRGTPSGGATSMVLNAASRGGMSGDDTAGLVQRATLLGR